MSDAMSDHTAVNRLADKVLGKTEELRDAIKAADEGVRGLRPELRHLLARMNDILEETGLEIRRR